MTQSVDFPTYTAARNPDGTWASGNPGRKPGSKNKFAATTMEQIKGLKDDAIASLAVQVKNGNMDAVRFILERIVGRNRTIELDGGSPADVTNALIDGDISAEEAKAIATVVEKLRRVQDMDDLTERLDAVEKLLRDGDTI